MTRPAPVPVDADRRVSYLRRWLLVAVILFAIMPPAVHALGDHGHGPAARWFLFAGSLAFVAPTVLRVVIDGIPSASRPVPWAALTLIVGLAVALIVVGQSDWLAVLAIAPAACGRYCRSYWPAAGGTAACGAAGLAVSAVHGAPFGTTLSVVLLPVMAAFFSYSSARRLDAVDALRRTRADLARAAVSEERLRIARDMHDLLGHSLSLITLKAELAGRTISADPERAAREIAELQSVARRSLSEVREAVAGYRQPDLEGELSAARQLLDSAGIAAVIDSPDTSCLSRSVDAALAWAVREGTTNVVRHSRASKVAISVAATGQAVVAQITDNGPAAGSDEQLPARPGVSGSGLAGLRERVRALGGELAAGSVDPSGFRLRVEVPLGPEAA